MDWNKTKNILIIAFLGINILLSYKLWFDSGPQAFSPWIVPEKEKEVLAHLEGKNISYEGEIPGEIKSKSFYDVQSKSFDEKRFFDSLNVDQDEFEKIEYENLTFYLGPKGKTIYVYKSGMVKFDFPKGYIPPNSFLKGHNRSIINTAYWGKDFVDSTFTNDHIFLDKINLNDNNEIELIYHQKMEGENFYGGYLRLVLSPLGIKRGQFFWLNFEGKSETSIEIIPASTALLRFSNYFTTGENIDISELSFGYYTQKFFAKNWEAVPVWSIRLDNGDNYFINAFTGELEGTLEAFEGG